MKISAPGDKSIVRRRPGWDLREEPPEEAPVVTYRMSPEEIAARYGPPNPVGRPITNVMYDPRLGRPMLPMTIDVLRKLAAEGKTAEEIAAELGRSAAGVRYRAKQWGVELVEERTQAEEQVKHGEEKWPVGAERLRELFVDQGLSAQKIAQKLGTTESAVRNALARHGVRRKQLKPLPGQVLERARADFAGSGGLMLHVSDRLEADKARQVLQSVAELIGSNPLMAAVEIELRVRASG